jgi:hypothetical protein
VKFSHVNVLSCDLLCFLKYFNRRRLSSIQYVTSAMYAFCAVISLFMRFDLVIPKTFLLYCGSEIGLFFITLVRILHNNIPKVHLKRPINIFFKADFTVFSIHNGKTYQTTHLFDDFVVGLGFKYSYVRGSGTQR